MSATPYKPVLWSEGPVRVDTLNQMANNDQWLFENTGRMFYYAHSIRRTAGVKILCGMIYMPAAKTHFQNAIQYFPNFFSAGCQPVVVGSLYSPQQGRIHLVFRGIGREFPDHRGFLVQGAVDEINPASNFFHTLIRVGWLAMGW
jgi:hypothetical protein